MKIINNTSKEIKLYIGDPDLDTPEMFKKLLVGESVDLESAEFKVMSIQED